VTINVYSKVLETLTDAEKVEHMELLAAIRELLADKRIGAV